MGRRLAGVMLWGVLTAPALAEDAQQILACMRANVPPALRAQKVELSYTDTDAHTHVINGRFFEMRERTASGRPVIQMMLRVDAPADVAGTAYLVQQSEQGSLLAEGLYVYLPATKTVRHIGGDGGDSPLLGTSFTYNDFKQFANAFEGSMAVIEPSSEAYKRPAHVISFTPVGAANETLHTARVWVDAKTCLPLKVDYYEGKKLRKQMTTPDFSLQSSTEGWFLSEIDMNDLRDGTSTVLKITGAEKASDVPKSYFDPAKFYLAK